jgi:hypothetical protein
MRSCLIGLADRSYEGIHWLIDIRHAMVEEYRYRAIRFFTIVFQVQFNIDKTF